MTDYYAILDVRSDATGEEIKKAYRKRAFETHPDRRDDAKAHEEFVKVRAAYETLSDPHARALYDRKRARPEENTAASAGARSVQKARQRVWQQHRQRRSVRRRGHGLADVAQTSPEVMKYAGSVAIGAMSVYAVVGIGPIVTVLVWAVVLVFILCVLDLLDDVVLGGRIKDLLSE